MPDVLVHVLPDLLPPAGLTGGVAVVIDILRASTTIVHALARGAERLIPCASIEEAHSIATDVALNPAPAESASAAPSERPTGADHNARSDSSHQVKGPRPLMGGERQGKLIPGFDLDNSPFSYTAERVSGRTIVFTTTNGTRALRACESAERVLIGAFVNFSAVVQELQRDGRHVHLVCAGTDGQMTAEDILFAGLVAQRLSSADAGGRYSPADAATEVAIEFAAIKTKTPERFRETLRQSRGGANLVALGYDRDIERASELDLFTIVPEWSRETRDIRGS